MRTLLIIPCFNEAGRLRRDAVEELLARPDVGILFVDDASTDDTADLLRQLVAAHEVRCQVVTNPGNLGKGESVRRGMQQAMAQDPELIGYLDADFATPPSEMLRLIELAESRGERVIMGCRILRLGAKIERSALRHYVGRVFATFASLILDLPVYDTQCGAKVFRNTELLRHAVATPFLSRWAFDVELIGRLCRGWQNEHYEPSDFLEVPLNQWIDTPGSKLKMKDRLTAMVDTFRIWREFR